MSNFETRGLQHAVTGTGGDLHAAGVDEQRGAARKPHERRVALPDVKKRDVKPAVARAATNAHGSASIHIAAARRRAAIREPDRPDDHRRVYPPRRATPAPRP